MNAIAASNSDASAQEKARHRSDQAARVFVICLCVCLFFKVTVVSASPWFEVWTTLSSSVLYYSTISYLVSFSIYGIAVVAGLVAWFFLGEKLGRHHLPGTCAALLAIWVMMRFLSSLVHGNVGAENIIFYVAFLGLLMLSAQIRPCSYDYLARFLAKALVAMACLCAAVAILQWFLVGGFGSGFTFRRYRITGFMFDAILTGLLYSIALMCLAYLQNKQLLRIPLMVAATVLLVFAGLLTGSRSFFYFSAIALAYFVFLNRDVKAILVLGLIAVMAVCVLPDLISNSSVVSMTDDSLRDEKAELAVNLFATEPLVGIGTDAFPDFDLTMGSGRGTNPHNIYLQVLCENGLICFVPLMLWVCSLVFRQRDVDGRELFALALTILFLFASAIICTIGDYWTLAFWILLSRLADISSSKARERLCHPRR